MMILDVVVSLFDALRRGCATNASTMGRGQASVEHEYDPVLLMTVFTMTTSGSLDIYTHILPNNIVNASLLSYSFLTFSNNSFSYLVLILLFLSLIS